MVMFFIASGQLETAKDAISLPVLRASNIRYLLQVLMWLNHAWHVQPVRCPPQVLVWSSHVWMYGSLTFSSLSTGPSFLCGERELVSMQASLGICNGTAHTMGGPYGAILSRDIDDWPSTSVRVRRLPLFATLLAR
jgi:hypothetical protein